MKTGIAAVFGTALLALALPAQAATVQFSNFDAITSPDFAVQGYTIIPSADGWLAGDNGIEIQHDNVAGRSFSGLNHVELDTTANSRMFYALGAGRYKVSYWYSPRPGVGSGSNGIDLRIGGTLLDSITGNGGGDTVWQKRIVSFATLGDTLRFQATGTSDGLGGYLDNIRVSTVPEPGAWALMIIGFGFVGLSSRRKHQRAVAA